MVLIWLLLSLIAWSISYFLTKFSLSINEHTHNERSLFDYAPSFPFSDLSIIGFLLEILFSFTIGVILKYSPWWLAKTLVLFIGTIFFGLGILALIQIFV